MRSIMTVFFSPIGGVQNVSLSADTTFYRVSGRMMSIERCACFAINPKQLSCRRD
jgi:hypothetical protein